MKLAQILILIRGVLSTVIPQLKKVDSIEGIKETKEALVGVNELSVFLAVRFADGVDLGDLKALWDKWSDDKDFQDKMKAAADNVSRVKAEVKDIDAGEGLELVNVQLDYLPKLLEAFKKPEEPAA